ncbi:ATP-binding cassette domain-containing protein [Moraxella osloensis]|uniref:amino acid ABC transporter ATP-binding/permease protein n=1 Tax=Faucicola osloensis TaxID=34062 RepID=UPI0020034A65|nr:ATP-binding cassette domain-containing protein [Moraxella osloensis]MCK6157244.1 ATP-binding cassette domain-containing protein [Moraxella osloensis]
MTAPNSEKNSENKFASENRLISQKSLAKTHPQKKANSHQTFRLTQLFSTQLDKWLIAACLGIMTALSVIGLLMTSGWFISAAAMAGMLALGSHSFNYLVPAAIIRVMAMVRTAGRYGEMMVSHHAVFGLLRRLRVRFFNQFARLPLANLSTTLQSTHAMHRLTHDIEVLNELPLRVVSPWLVATTASLLVATLLYQYEVNPMLIAIFLIAGLMLPAMLTWRSIKHARAHQALAESRRVSLLNPLSALTHLLIWQRWQSELTAFNSLDTQHTHQQKRIQRAQSLVMLIMQWLIAAVLVGLLVGFYHTPLVISVPMLLALFLGIMGMTDLLAPLVTHSLALGNSLAAKHQLNELLNPSLQPSHHLNHDLAPLPIDAARLNAPLTLTINQLAAKMPQAIVGFKAISLTATQGIPVLITGRSGAGKSTLLQVLAHELAPQQGSIELSGMDWLALPNTPALTGYLGQQIDIFDQTLATNLRLGNADASDEQLWQVLGKVGLKDWARNQPLQLQTPLGEYGQAISGGQARRIALARLLLTPKKILLLDEPFAGLDKKRREALWQMLVQHQQQGILIIVTHHLWQTECPINIVQLPEPDVFI